VAAVAAVAAVVAAAAVRDERGRAILGRQPLTEHPANARRLFT